MHGCGAGPLRHYEQFANSRDGGQVAPMIADHAVYGFTGGEFAGLDVIRGASERTWSTVEHERYAIEHLH